ncbi:MAG: hypothetical protein AAB600_00530 [Patescibacteria group bacterium]
MKKLFIFFGLLIILAIGSWLRLSGIISNSFAFTYDVGRDMLAVENIVVNHKITLIGQTTGVEGIFYGPWWYFILSIPFFIFSGNPQGIAFFMAFIGIITIFLSYIVGEKIGGVFLGIIFSAFISISSIMVLSSSQIWNPNPIPFFVLLVFLMLYMLSFDSKPRTHGVRGKPKTSKAKYLFLLGLLLGITIDMEIVFGILLFLGTCISLILIFRKRLRIKEVPFFALGLLFIFSPRIIFEVRHDFLMTKTFINAFSNGFMSPKHFSIFDALFSKLGSLFNVWNATLAGQNSTVGFILIAFVSLCLLFFYKKIEDTQKQFMQTIFIVIVIFLIGFIFLNQAIWPHYLVGIPVFYILLVSLIINTTKIVLKKSWVIFFILLVLFWINLNPMQVLDNIRKPIWEGNAAVYRNQVAVIDYVFNDAKGKDFKYIVYTPAVHDYTYRYLFSWYGKKKYSYIPGQKNTGLFYVILEPDYDLPFRLKDWLNDREDDGTIQKEKIVKGGITVQTRILNIE